MIPLVLTADYEPRISVTFNATFKVKKKTKHPITLNTGKFEQVLSKSIECRFERHSTRQEVVLLRVNVLFQSE